MTDYCLFEMVEMLMAASGGDDRLAQQYPTLAGYHARILAQPTFGAYYNSDACLKAPFFPSMAKLQMWPDISYFTNQTNLVKKFKIAVCYKNCLSLKLVYIVMSANIFYFHVYP